MGMFDKDKQVGLILTSYVSDKEEVILWDASVIREDFPTNMGPSPQAELTISRMANPDNRVKVTTLGSAIIGKVREAEASDFPAIVYWTRVWSDKWNRNVLVLQFVAPWTGKQSQDSRAQQSGSDGFTPRTETPTTDPVPVDDDIPF